MSAARAASSSAPSCFAQRCSSPRPIGERRSSAATSSSLCAGRVGTDVGMLTVRDPMALDNVETYALLRSLGVSRYEDLGMSVPFRSVVVAIVAIVAAIPPPGGCASCRFCV